MNTTTVGVTADDDPIHSDPRRKLQPEDTEKELAMADDRNERAHSARSMTEATSRDNMIESYAAINAVDEHAEISKLAYQYYLERGEKHGTPEDDWMRAELEVRRTRASSIGQGGIEPEGAGAWPNREGGVENEELP